MTTIGLGDFVTALRMRDLIKKLVSEEIEAQRPKIQYATVVTIDRAARKCIVQYPDDTGTVKVSMGSIQPSREGQVVRIDGPLGDRFISDVMGTVFTDSINAAHPAVRAATTAATTLSGTKTIDGVALGVNDRILVKNQASWPENGVYEVRTGAWTRTADADQTTDVAAGATWFVLEGTENARRSFMQIQPIITVGVSGLEFVEPTIVEHVGPFSYPGPIRKGHILYDTFQRSIVTWNGGAWEVANSIHVCTSTTRPTFVSDGHLIYETDTKRFAIMSGGSWVYNDGYPEVFDLNNTDDLNNFEQTGLWNQNANADASTTRNYPSNHAGLLEVFRAIASGGMIHQRYSTYDGKRVWWRARYTGAWSSWVSVGHRNLMWRGYAASSQAKTTGINNGVTLNLDYASDVDFTQSGATWNRIIPQSGYYEITAQCTWAANGTGTRSLELRKNITGTDLSTGTTLVRNQQPPTSGSLIATYAEWKGELQAGDTIAMTVLQTSGGNLDVIGTSYQTWIEFELRYPT